MTERTRPQSVPAEAWWSEQDKEWILGPKDAQGRLHGKVRYWRPDGTLCCSCDHVAGKPHGSSVRFHESGEESQTCDFVDGAIHGTRTWYATDQPTTEGMHANGVSRKVRRLEMDYEHGEFVSTRFYDGDGNPLCRDGSPLPPRPSGVAPGAVFQDGRWVSGRWNEKGQRTGLLRHHTREGVLMEETQWRDDIGEGPHRAYDLDGELREQVTYRKGLREGTASTYRLDGTLARTAELSGGEYHGALRDYDATGTRVVREVRFEHGVRTTPPAPTPPAPAVARRPPEDWRARIASDEVQWLDLSHLGLERLPDEVRGLRRLRTLKLVNNRLRSLPTWLMELESLQGLSLARNRLPLPRTGRGVLAHFRRTRTLPEVDRRVRFCLFMGDVAQARSEGDVPALVRALSDEDPSLRAHAELALAGARPSPLVSGRRVYIAGVPRQRRRSALCRELEAAGLVIVPSLQEADVVLLAGRLDSPTTLERPIAVEADLPAPPFDAKELARLFAAAEAHPQPAERWRARVRFRREAPLSLWAFVQGFAPGLDTYEEELLARRIRVLTRSGQLDARTLAEEVHRHNRRATTFLLEEGGPRTREVLATSRKNRVLDLSWKGLSRLPPEVGDFADVFTLNLAGNKLTSLPDEVGDLFCLHRLDLSHNPLRALPASLVRLNQLRRLSCEDTRLTPATSEPLFALTALNHLDLSHSNWDALPEAIGQLTRLTDLSLGGNDFTTLPASLARLQRLTWLHMTYNALGTVPPVLFELPALKTLWLERCKLRELPADIARLQQLETLVLWGNALESVPIDALTRLPRLKELRIRDNRLPPAHEAELRAALPRCVIY